MQNDPTEPPTLILLLQSCWTINPMLERQKTNDTDTLDFVDHTSSKSYCFVKKGVEKNVTMTVFYTWKLYTKRPLSL